LPRPTFITIAPSRHHRKGARAEDPLGFPGQRQQADGDVGLAEKPLEVVAAVKNRDLLLFPRRANPGCDGKAERLQHQCRRLRHHAVAEKPDAPFLGPDDPLPRPLPIGLGRLITGHVAMKAQHVHDDVLRHHRITARRLHLAERGLRQFGMVDKGVYACRAAEHRLQIGKCGKRVEIRMHEGEIFNIRHLSRIGPDANFQVWQLFGEGVAPGFRIADTLVEIDKEQRHFLS
jgi:hypothetical protein